MDICRLEWNSLVRLSINCPTTAGLVDADSPSLAVGTVEDSTLWLSEDRVRLFYDMLRRQLRDHVILEKLPPSKLVDRRSARAGVPPTDSATTSRASGVPAVLDGRVNKNQIKRMEKRRCRAEARAAERALIGLSTRLLQNRCRIFGP
ncbi:hypothetical protein Y032_0361g3461 [Ancylostoma ceylanicum]|uniref:Uncharacterized protein n=1 Tax=Ancylostoma ceylanicum TaxID=53326 RepID=A0A016RW48_9BILA|nr:hypothetical protein Y032_0361g3461 [Ancylostoma ceylanicum]